MLYLIGILLIIIALSLAVTAPRNLWDTWLGTAGVIVLFVAVSRNPFFAEYRWVNVLFGVVDVLVQYVAPLFAVIVSLFMVVYAITLYRSEANRLQLTIGLGIAALLMGMGLFVYYLAFFGNYVEQLKWLRMPDYLVVYYFFLLVNFLINTVRLSFLEDESRQNYVIILGGKIYPNGTPSELVSNRLDTALNYLNRQRYLYQHTPMVIVSGADTIKGSDLTEARVMANYLMARGIPRDKLILEERAQNTHDNFIYTKEILKSRHMNLETVHAIYVTNSFHLYRSELYSNMEGLYHFSGLGAPATVRQWLENGFREFVALIFMHRKFHFFVSLILLGLRYFSYRWI
ncbi:MAG: YdcF family protein [Aerococcus sp.]|nr:YdcF family protein [Aerococcus sp.]